MPTQTVRVQCVRSDAHWVQCVAPDISVLYEPGDFDRLDFLPRVGQFFDLILELMGDGGTWADGKFRLTIATPVGIANVGEAS